MDNANTTIQYVLVDHLRYDPLNPRLPSTTDGKDNEAVLSTMLKDGSIIELMGSIGEQDYFVGDPLLVCPNPIEQGTYIVVEGNRRFTAVKLLSNPELAPTNKVAVKTASEDAKYKPTSLPVVVYADRGEILGYLSYRHITGVKPWGSLAKARYLYQLRQNLTNQPIQDQMKHLAKTIGTRADYVRRLLTGYALYEFVVDADFFSIPNLNEDSIDFSLLTTALTYSNLIAFIGLKNNDDPEIPGLKEERLKELTRWVFEKPEPLSPTRLGESRNLKYLSHVVANEQAIRAFRQGMPLLEAKDLTSEPAEVVRVTISQAKARLRIANDNIHHLDQPTTTDSENLRDIVSIARNLKTIVDGKLTEAEEEVAEKRKVRSKRTAS